MRAWEELTRQERKDVMKNYRAEWIRDCKSEIRMCGDDDGFLHEILHSLLKSESPAIVYDCVIDEYPEDLIRYYSPV